MDCIIVNIKGFKTGMNLYNVSILLPRFTMLKSFLRNPNQVMTLSGQWNNEHQPCSLLISKQDDAL